LFSFVSEEEKTEWVEINANGISLENKRGFGGPRLRHALDPITWTGQISPIHLL
jgi:hypothetical protein